MRAAQVSQAGGEFEIIERDIPQPKKNEVLIKVEACGVCHSDVFVKEGLFPGMEFPRIPGHEVVGRVEQFGDGVSAFKTGQRVGIGWHGGHCFQCDPCREGDFVTCESAKITGIHFDGGYAEYMVAPAEGLALVPTSLSSVEAAPLLCAGITTYNALRNSKARGGDTVVVHGIGGLGHLGLQFASKLGFKTIAVSRGTDKRELALKLGAYEYIDTDQNDPVEELLKMGGAKVILATAPNSKAIASLINALGANGQLLVIAATAEPMEISPVQLIGRCKEIKGWSSGHAKDSEDTLNFSALSNIRPMVETFPLSRVNEAYQTMMENKARFRTVLTMDE